MKTKASWILLLSTLLASSSLVAQAPPVLKHDPLECVPDRCRNVKVMAQVQDPVAVQQVIAYFRADDEANNYYIVLRQSEDDPSIFWGILPIVHDDTEWVHYFIEALDVESRVVRTAVVHAEVSEECVVPELTDEEKDVSHQLTIGQTVAGQESAPVGFRCHGIRNEITAAGELRSSEDCRQLLARGDDIGCGIAAWPLVLAGTGGAVGTAILIDDDDEPPTAPPLSPATP